MLKGVLNETYKYLIPRKNSFNAFIGMLNQNRSDFLDNNNNLCSVIYYNIQLEQRYTVITSAYEYV